MIRLQSAQFEVIEQNERKLYAALQRSEARLLSVMK